MERGHQLKAAAGILGVLASGALFWVLESLTEVTPSRAPLQGHAVASSPTVSRSPAPAAVPSARSPSPRPAAASGSEDPSSEELRAILWEAIQDDRLCRFRYFMAQADPEDLVSVFLRLPDSRSYPEIETQVFESLVQENAVGIMSASLLHPGASMSVDFFAALAMGGLLEGIAPPPGADNLSRAASLLEALSRGDPRNAAYPYFLAAVRARQESPRPEIQSVVSELFRGSGFDTGFEDFILDRVDGRALQGPSQYLLAQLVRARLPVPDFLTTQRLILREIDEGEWAVARDALRFAEILMSGTSSATGDLIRYGTGKGIYTAAYRRLNPGLALPRIDSVQDIVRRHNAQGDESVPELLAPPKGTPPDFDDCDRAPFDRLYRRALGR
jgi:hypothetical protein